MKVKHSKAIDCSEAPECLKYLYCIRQFSHLFKMNLMWWIIYIWLEKYKRLPKQNSIQAWAECAIIKDNILTKCGISRATFIVGNHKRMSSIQTLILNWWKNYVYNSTDTRNYILQVQNENINTWWTHTLNCSIWDSPKRSTPHNIELIKISHFWRYKMYISNVSNPFKLKNFMRVLHDREQHSPTKHST